MSVIIGIDAGGSHVEAIAGLTRERILARWRGGAGSVRPGAETAAVEQWHEAVRQLLGRLPGEVVTQIVVGAAGTGREATRLEVERRFAASLDGAPRVRVTTDGVIAMEAAFPGGRPGIVLMAGSGSIAYGRGRHGGDLRRKGGLGWRIGDEGGGYWLAREALAAVGRALDGRGDPTVLVEHLSGAIGATAPEDLVRWSVAAGASTIATLAPVVSAAAVEGDRVASELVQRAGHELAVLVANLWSNFNGTVATDVAAGGGLLAGESPVREAFMRNLREQAATLSVLDEPVDPPIGALELARKL